MSGNRGLLVLAAAACVVGVGIAVAVVVSSARKREQKREKEEKEEKVSVSTPVASEDEKEKEAVFDAVFHAVHSSDNEAALRQLRVWSSDPDFQRRIIRAGLMDRLNELQAWDTLANLAANPTAHPYFFSGRFRLDDVADEKQRLRIALNLSFTTFGAKMCVEKLNALQTVKQMQSKGSVDEELVKKVLANLEQK